jgi:hypothetical protein
LSGVDESLESAEIPQTTRKIAAKMTMICIVAVESIDFFSQNVKRIVVRTYTDG